MAAAASSSMATSTRTNMGHSNAGLPWVEKYRPTDLGEILAHKDVVGTISNLIDQNRLPHLLLYGPPGTGKTTTVLACARKLYGPSFRKFVLELNASDERGIAVVRNQIKDFASTRNIFGNVPFKLILLDEADQMTGDAQAALRRIIEKFTRNARFCLVCNQVNKITPALQSRCTRFRLGPLPRADVLPRLRFVAAQESVPFTEDGLQAIYRLSNGDMRRCMNILQATYTSMKKVDQEAVYRCTGNPSPEDVRGLLQDALSMTFDDVVRKFEAEKTDKGFSVSDLLPQILLLVERIDMPDDAKIFLYRKLAEIEHIMAFASNEKLSTYALIGALQMARVATANRVAIDDLVPEMP